MRYIGYFIDGSQDLTKRVLRHEEAQSTRVFSRLISPDGRVMDELYEQQAVFKNHYGDYILVYFCQEQKPTGTVAPLV